jgi:hypothetical protein
VIVAQLLVPEHQHVVPVPRLLDGLDFASGDAREVNPLHLRADHPEGPDLHLQDG